MRVLSLVAVATTLAACAGASAPADDSACSGVHITNVGTPYNGCFVLTDSIVGNSFVPATGGGALILSDSSAWSWIGVGSGSYFRYGTGQSNRDAGIGLFKRPQDDRAVWDALLDGATLKVGVPGYSGVIHTGTTDRYRFIRVR
jgi:hypothetical protein